MRFNKFEISKTSIIELLMERKMFFSALPNIFIKARWLRVHMTCEEKLLWKRLKNNKLGVRFKAQHPIETYIADFYCHKLKLVVEIDGENHQGQKVYDRQRTNYMDTLGIRTIRFQNQEVRNNIENIIAILTEVIGDLSTTANKNRAGISPSGVGGRAGEPGES